jgi:DNA-binding beta-propeller fold protein YncE
MRGRLLFLGALATTAACSGAAPTRLAEVKGATSATANVPTKAPAPEAALAVTITAPAASGRCARQHPGEGAARLGASHQGSTVALATMDGVALAYVADEDDGALHTFALEDGGSELAVTPLDGSPSQLLVLDDGRVAVTLRDRNRVVILEPAERPDLPLQARCDAAVAVEPVGLATSPDGARLFVTSGWGHALTALDAGDLATAFTVDLPREPRAILVDDDGRRAFVAHVVGATMSAVSLDTSEHAVHAIDLRIGSTTGCQGYALTKTSLAAPGPDAIGAGSGRVFAPMVRVDPGDPRPSFGYGGALTTPAETALVSVVDTTAERTLTRARGGGSATPRGECLLPRSATMGPDGGLLVSCLGIDAVVELDARAQNPATVERRRFRVPAGPTGVAADVEHHRAVVWSQFARELSVLDLTAPVASKPGAKPAPDALPSLRLAAARHQGSWVTPQIARGRALFHATDDGRLSRDGRACASCHPDGREDALTWSTPDGPRQTIMLAGRVVGSEPYGWFGTNKTLPAHVTRTLQRLGGTGLATNKADLDALLAYLGALRAPSLVGAPRPAVRAELIDRGRGIFLEPAQGCATCHFGAGTDKLAHDVKTGNIDETSLRFDTPSLRYVSGTAPYFHDGRFRSLEDVMEHSDGTMGHTMHLSRPDLLALVAYLETL